MAAEKLKIEDLAHSMPDGEFKNNTLDLLAFLKTIKVNLYNKLSYKSKRVGRLNISSNNDFMLQIFTQFDSYLFDLLAGESDEIKGFAEKQTVGNNCPRCISGKCAVTNITITTPDKTMIEFAKKLITLRCDAIVNSRIPKCNYIKLSERGKMQRCAKCKVCDPACRRLRNF